MSAPAKASGALRSVDYEVFGRVQGVCFRMYTEQEAKKLGVVGWVKNTSQGTVTGQVQGPEEKVNEILKGAVMTLVKNLYSSCMVKETKHSAEEEVHESIVIYFKKASWKSWLSKVGSPSSRIDKTSFSNEKEISKLDFSDFNTRY